MASYGMPRSPCTLLCFLAHHHLPDRHTHAAGHRRRSAGAKLTQATRFCLVNEGPAIHRPCVRLAVRPTARATRTRGLVCSTRRHDPAWSGCRATGQARCELDRSPVLPVRPAVNGGRGWQGACETRATRLQIKQAAAGQCTPVPVIELNESMDRDAYVGSTCDGYAIIATTTCRSCWAVAAPCTLRVNRHETFCTYRGDVRNEFRRCCVWLSTGRDGTTRVPRGTTYSYWWMLTICMLWWSRLFVGTMVLTLSHIEPKKSEPNAKFWG